MAVARCCDRCGLFFKDDDFKYPRIGGLEIRGVSLSNHFTAIINPMDLCDGCAEKLLEFLYINGYDEDAPEPETPSVEEPKEEKPTEPKEEEETVEDEKIDDEKEDLKDEDKEDISLYRRL